MCIWIAVDDVLTASCKYRLYMNWFWDATSNLMNVVQLGANYTDLYWNTVEPLYKRHALGSNSCLLYEVPFISRVPHMHLFYQQVFQCSHTGVFYTHFPFTSASLIKGFDCSPIYTVVAPLHAAYTACFIIILISAFYAIPWCDNHMQ